MKTCPRCGKTGVHTCMEKIMSTDDEKAAREPWDIFDIEVETSGNVKEGVAEKLAEFVNAKLKEAAHKGYNAGIAHQKAKERWRKYPEEEPTQRGTYIVEVEKKEGRKQVKLMFWTGDKFYFPPKPHRGTQVIRWKPIELPTKEATDDSK